MTRTPPARSEPGHAATVTIDIGAYLLADRADRLRLNPQPLAGTPVRLTASPGSQEQDFELRGRLQ